MPTLRVAGIFSWITFQWNIFPAQEILKAKACTKKPTP